MYKICDIDIKKVHDQLFLILTEFDQICKKNNINYSLEGGTLLGAEKYHDFVPWDDDIDIIMLRPDYEKFLQICKTDLNSDFFLQNFNTDYYFPLNYSKLRLNNTKYVQKNYDMIDIHQGIFIDIFCYDYVTKSNFLFKKVLIGILSGIRSYKLKLLLNNKRCCQKVVFYKRIIYILGSIIPIKNINKMINYLMISKKRTKYLFCFCNYLKTDKPFLAEHFNQFTEIQFRNKKFQTIYNYKSWLKKQFGNYLIEEPNKETRGPSHAITECMIKKENDKKIGILTFHNANNYGAVLQSYALSHFINKIIEDKQINYNCEIINYINNDIENRYKLKSILEYKFLKTKIKYLILYKYLKKNIYNFDIFRKTYLNITKNNYNKNNIKDSNNYFDIFIVGSDQVWNRLLTNDDYTYFLDFSYPNKKKISYAASVGIEQIFIKELNKYKKFLNSFSCISVRENSLHQKLNDNNISNGFVLDPVFLLDKEYYTKIESNKNIVNQPYILVYVIAMEKNIFKFAKKLSKLTGYDLVLINPDNFNKLGYLNLKDIPVQNFLTLIKNANYVITSSFHGLAFSLIYNTEVFIQLSNQEKNFNSRINTLIELCVLQKNVINDNFNFNITNKINWEIVNNKINDLKNKSQKFLIDSIFNENI